MAEEIRKTDESTGLVVGLVFLVALGYGLYRLGSYIASKWQTPPPVVALSAYFADDHGVPVLDEKATNAHLKIKGQVQRPDNQATDGKVRVTVETIDQAFSQTLIIEAKGGNFETEDVSLRKLRPDDQIHIKAEFLSSAASIEPPGEIYLNTRPPKVTSDTVWAIVSGALVAVFIVFFYSFTGKKTPLKNRIAVIFSYVVIGIFLLLPLMAPVFFVPTDRRAMTDRPVALVLTRVGPADDARIQWALNIGGYASAPAMAPSPTPPPARSPARAGSPSVSPQPTATPTGSPAAAPGESPTTSPSPTPSSTQAQQASASPSPGTRTPSPSPTPIPVADTDEDLIVNVEGGLVIPLYVIILSVIGGAINMTRKVPQLQEEGERSDMALPVRATWSATVEKLRSKLRRRKRPGQQPPPTLQPAANETSEEVKPPEPETGSAPPPVTPPPTVAAQPSAAIEPDPDTLAGEIDIQIGELLEVYAKSDSEAQESKKHMRDLIRKMKDLFDKRQDKKPILDFESFDDWLKSKPALKDMFTTHWRVELLSQYMYLVSAPFLAIVAYYMLELAGLTKQPILVLISFSVGLVSERILSWLLGIASGYLRESPSQTGSR